MKTEVRLSFLARIRARWFSSPPPLSAEERARQLIQAVDRGGIPLNPARINAIARDLGLEVSRKARPEETIERIRLALGRIENGSVGF
ncbi:MAG: hypothetical protein RBS35_06845 [Azonexus sp.]|jgi:hypothetical protein|nr:hypothetical protein [Azonexus sp.]